MLSLAHLTVLPADPVALIEIGARAGFDAVGLRVVPPFATDTIIPVVGDPALQTRIKKQMNDAGVSIFDVEAFWLMPESDLDHMRRAIDVGGELGARYVLVVGNDPDRVRLMDNFSTLCEHCSEIGLRPMLEFIPYSQIRSLPEAYEFLKDAGETGAGLLVDALHLSRSGGKPADIAYYPDELFSYMHLCDAPLPPPTGEDVRLEARGRRLYPGEGDLPLIEFVNGFGQGTAVSVEAPNERYAQFSLVDQARLAAEAARDLLARAAAGRH